MYSISPLIVKLIQQKLPNSNISSSNARDYIREILIDYKKIYIPNMPTSVGDKKIWQVIGDSNIEVPERWFSFVEKIITWFKLKPMPTEEHINEFKFYYKKTHILSIYQTEPDIFRLHLALNITKKDDLPGAAIWANNTVKQISGVLFIICLALGIENEFDEPEEFSEDEYLMSSFLTTLTES